MVCAFVVITFVKHGYTEAAQTELELLKEQMAQMKAEFQSMRLEINLLKSQRDELARQVSDFTRSDAGHGKGRRMEHDEPLPDNAYDINRDHHTVNPFGLRVYGGATGVFQASFGNNPQDTTNAQGSIDLFFEADVARDGLVMVYLEAVGNNGPDSALGTFSGLNGDAGSSDSSVSVLEAYYEQELFDGRLAFTVGKIDLTNYFDTNEVANDETTQFLAGAFVNSAVLDTPDNGPGIRATYSICDCLDIGIGVQSGDGDGNFIFDRVFAISELDYKTQINGLEGNWRAYISMHGNRHEVGNNEEHDECVGFGFSADQKLSETITWFGRVGFTDEHIAQNQTEWVWSSGIQFETPSANRPDDVFAIAVGQVKPNREVIPNRKRATFDEDETQAPQNDMMPHIETLAEIYYSYKVNERFFITPNLQIVFQPSGDTHEDSIVVCGLRGQVNF